MKTEYKVFIGIALAAIGVYLLVNYLDDSKYKEENKAYELLIERLRADSIVSAEIIAQSEHREDSLLEDAERLKGKVWRYKRQKDELEDRIIDQERHDYSLVPDSLKLHVFDSLLTELERAQARLDNTIKNH